jgi:hypothetical protein
MDETELRTHLRTLLDGESAHVSFFSAVENFPVADAGSVPEGWAWSPWQLLEHVRRAEQDLYEYCAAEHYTQLSWPDDYWPDHPQPPDAGAWEHSVEGFCEIRSQVLALLDDVSISVFETVPHSNIHTYLREFLLIADHAAYHAGQMVALRRALGSWPP